MTLSPDMPRYGSPLIPLLLIPLVFSAAAQDMHVPGLFRIDTAYVSEAPPGTGSAAAYFVIHNPADEELYLLGAASGIAESVAIHRSEMEDGMMSMRELDMILIPPGGELLMEPGGIHIMLTGLRSAVTAGDRIDVELLFHSGAGEHRYLFSVPVRSL